MRHFVRSAATLAAAAAFSAGALAQTTTLKMQATWPASLTLYENFTYFAERVGKMPGGEIIPSAQRGVIDCAEWVGGVEDLRLGFQNVWKYHYTPGVHENVTIGEVIFNQDVWKTLKPEHQEIIKGAANETFIVWWAKWQRQNADAIKELQAKHAGRILRTPP